MFGPGAPSQMTLEQSYDSAFTQAGFVDILTEWIVLAQAPFYTVESKAFKRLVQSLNKRARIPSADTIKNRVMDLFVSLRAKRDALLDAAPGKLTFSSMLLTCLVYILSNSQLTSGRPRTVFPFLALSSIG
jgi:hypothetical protein